MKKKIAISATSLHVGGTERVLINLLNNIDFNLYEVDLFLWKKGGEFESFVPKNVNIRCISDEHPWFKKTNKYYIVHGIIRKIIRLFNNSFYFKLAYKRHNLTNKKYDVAIAFSSNCLYTNYFIAFSNAKRKYIWLHSDYKMVMRYNKGYRKNFYKYKNKYSYFDKIVAVSKSAAESFINMFPKYKNKVIVIWNLICETKENENATNNILNVKQDDSYKVISIGRMVKTKGFERLIEVAKKIINNGYDVKFYLIGSGPEEENLKKKVEEYCLKDKVIFLGAIYNPYPILRQADLFLLTSFYEGLPTVLLESLMCGVPIVAPNIPGARDIYEEIAPENSMILVENNINDIYKGVLSALNNKVNKDFSFNIKEYNQKIIQEYYKIFNN